MSESDDKSMLQIHTSSLVMGLMRMLHTQIFYLENGGLMQRSLTAALELSFFIPRSLCISKNSYLFLLLLEKNYFQV